jgi:predicted metal-dependent HD superfamily phosphohydrolase
MEACAMIVRSAVAEKADALVTALYREKLPSWARYHTIGHTREVVAGCMEIGMGMQLSEEELDVIVLAAWFHDAGYVDGADGHEERSAAIAGEFLKKEGYPAERIPLVLGCIRATKLPQQPSTALERIVCDADVMYIGGNRFREHSDALREEWEKRMEIRFGEVEWLQKNVEFVGRCDFHTGYVRRTYGAMRTRNLAELYERLDNAVKVE